MWPTPTFTPQLGETWKKLSAKNIPQPHDSSRSRALRVFKSGIKSITSFSEPLLCPPALDPVCLVPSQEVETARCSVSSYGASPGNGLVTADCGGDCKWASHRVTKGARTSCFMENEGVVSVHQEGSTVLKASRAVKKDKGHPVVLTTGIKLTFFSFGHAAHVAGS